MTDHPSLSIIYLDCMTAAELSLASLLSQLQFHLLLIAWASCLLLFLHQRWNIGESECHSVYLFVYVIWGRFYSLNLSAACIGWGQRLGADLWCNQELISALLLADRPPKGSWVRHTCKPHPPLYSHSPTHTFTRAHTVHTSAALPSFSLSQLPSEPVISLSKRTHRERTKAPVHLKPRTHYKSRAALERADGVNTILSPAQVA